MRPSLHQFRIYGQKNGLILDQDQETLIRLRGTHYKSYAEKFVPPVNFAKQYLSKYAEEHGALHGTRFSNESGHEVLD